MDIQSVFLGFMQITELVLTSQREESVVMIREGSVIQDTSAPDHRKKASCTKIYDYDLLADVIFKSCIIHYV